MTDKTEICRQQIGTRVYRLAWYPYPDDTIVGVDIEVKDGDKWINKGGSSLTVDGVQPRDFVWKAFMNLLQTRLADALKGPAPGTELAYFIGRLTNLKIKFVDNEWRVVEE